MSKGFYLYSYVDSESRISKQEYKDGSWTSKKYYDYLGYVERKYIDLKARVMHDNDELEVVALDDEQNALLMRKIVIDSEGIGIRATGIKPEGRNGWSEKAVFSKGRCVAYGMYYRHENLFTFANMITVAAYTTPILRAAALFARGYLEYISKEIEQSQLYMAVTTDQSDWMKRMFKTLGQYHGIKKADILLENLALPGSHDSGMYLNLPAAVSIVANTQKDNIVSQLRLGARIFDFRPMSGYAFDRGVQNELAGLPAELKAVLDMIPYRDYLPMNSACHAHLIIPGEGYDTFMAAIGEFLYENQSEIVVVVLATYGIPSEFKMSSKSTDDVTVLKQGFNQAKKRCPGLKIGNRLSLKKSVEKLHLASERLIVLSGSELFPENEEREIAVTKSYKGSLAASIKAENVVTSLENLNQKSRKSWDISDMIDVGLQLTSVADSAVLVGQAKNLNKEGFKKDQNLLMATKGMCDQLSYKWLNDGQLREDTLNTLISIGNDFYDPGLTEVVANLNIRRLQKLKAQPPMMEIKADQRYSILGHRSPKATYLGISTVSEPEYIPHLYDFDKSNTFYFEPIEEHKGVSTPNLYRIKVRWGSVNYLTATNESVKYKEDEKDKARKSYVVKSLDIASGEKEENQFWVVEKSEFYGYFTIKSYSKGTFLSTGEKKEKYRNQNPDAGKQRVVLEDFVRARMNLYWYLQAYNEE